MANLKVGVLINAKDNASRTIKAVGGAMRGVVQVAGAAATAAASASAVAVAAADKQRQSEEGVALALAQTGQLTQENIQFLADQASAAQRMTTVGDETSLMFQKMALNMGASVKTAGQMTMASEGLAQALGGSTEERARQLAKTLGGYAGELGEVIPELKNMTKEQLQAGAAIDMVRQRFGNFATQEAQTVTGAFKQIANAAGDEMERVGFAIQQSGAVQVFLQNKDAIISAISDIGKFWAGIVGNLIDTTAQFGLYLASFWTEAVGFVLKFKTHAQTIWAETMAFWGSKLVNFVDEFGILLRAIGIDVGNIGDRFHGWVQAQKQSAKVLREEYKVEAKAIDAVVASTQQKLKSQSLEIDKQARGQQEQNQRLGEQVEKYRQINAQSKERARAESTTVNAIEQQLTGQEGIINTMSGALGTALSGSVSGTFSQVLSAAGGPMGQMFAVGAQPFIEALSRSEEESREALKGIFTGFVEQLQNIFQNIGGLLRDLPGAVGKGLKDKETWETAGRIQAGILTGGLSEVFSGLLGGDDGRRSDGRKEDEMYQIKKKYHGQKAADEWWEARVMSDLQENIDTNEGLAALVGMFHSGGVVKGNAANVPIMAKPGEMVLTRSDQSSLMNALKGGMSGSGATLNATINVQSRDPQEAAEYVRIGLQQLWRSNVLRSNPLTGQAR